MSGTRIESHVHSTSGFLPWIEFGEIRIQSYFVVVSLVLSACAYFIFKRSQKEHFESAGLDSRDALDLLIIAMVGGFAGARLLHVFWEEPRYYAEDPWRIVDVAGGGFVWLGGALGGLAALLVLLRWKRGNFASALLWLDFFAPVAAIGYAGGRVACVLTGCCFGAVCDWPVAFRFPTQGFSVVWELALGMFLLVMEKRSPKVGTVFFTWVALHGLGRVLMEVLRADPRGPALGPLTVSMGISLGLIVFGAFRLRQMKN